MFRNKTAKQHNFAIVPGAQNPRSKFPIRYTRKMGFNASELVPIAVWEVLPGDVWQHEEDIAARLATPIAPVLDDMDIETYWFFEPNRIAQGSQGTTTRAWEDLITGTNTSAIVPRIAPVITGEGNKINVNSVFDHMGLPVIAAITGSLALCAYPIFAYFHIWNEWFRDQNLQDPWIWSTTWAQSDSDQITQGGTAWAQQCLRVNKRHDYFTSSLPWPQKGNAVTLPLGTSAPVLPVKSGGFNVPPGFLQDATDPFSTTDLKQKVGDDHVYMDSNAPGNFSLAWSDATGLYTDLGNATAATINNIRMAFVMQQLLERDARGGSRYVENIKAHWGVILPDYTAQRPQYLGGGKYPVTVNPIAQTAAYDASPADAPSAIGNLGAEMHANGGKRTFTFAAVEHGYIIGLAVARTTPTYQQGVAKHWQRRTRADFWDPLYANLGEQAVLTKEIYQTANQVFANETWGYQERGAEYRYMPNEITGVLRSTVSTPMDWWHYAEEFSAEPALNAAFMYDKTQETLARSLYTGTGNDQWACQIIMDIAHRGSVARLMPTYSVPGLSRL